MIHHDLDELAQAAREALQPRHLVYLPPRLTGALERLLPRVLQELRTRREAAARGSLPGGTAP